MFYIEAPSTRYGRFKGKQSVFMAGGITDCPDWQREMRDLLVNDDIVLYNPRRAEFPMGDPDAAEAQITWEHKHLHESDAVLFWFPQETLCPIVLFELGAWSHFGRAVYSGGAGGHCMTESKPIFVGAHPEYQRRQDVVIQLMCERPEVEVVDSLAALAQQVGKWAKGEDT